ncbi:MAG: flagellar basal body P-ring protein FlgI [Armatimonadetes bacterium]|nr:flagellar basal body P-ring protein FlgI [Armatimonadota bacterium]
MKLSTLTLVFLAAATGFPAQQGAPGAVSQPQAQTKPAEPKPLGIRLDSKALSRAEEAGVEVRIKDIARFRGVRSNQLTGFGLVMGLEGTGDTKKTPMTMTLLSNLLKDWGTISNPATFETKNVALVMVTAELPPFVKPGTTIDVRVSSIGDAKSLQGGTLVQTPLYAAGDKEHAYAVAEGAVSIGGFNASSSGNSVQRNHVTVGRIPSGAIVEDSVPTKTIFGRRMYLELDSEDLTTANRVAQAISQAYPAFSPDAEDGATICLNLPEGMTPVQAMSLIESVKVFADIEAKVVINERTGTIVIGGNVRLGPAAIAHGSLSIKIEQEPIVSQPNPFSSGQTTVVNETTVRADQDTAKVAMIPPNTTVADLSRILQTLELKPTEIISILQALRQQGALKARIELQ